MSNETTTAQNATQTTTQTAGPANPFASMFAAFAPFTQLAMPNLPTPTFAAPEAFQKAMSDQADRMKFMADEMAKAQAHSLAQTRAAIDESARLMRATVDYQAQLQAEWRKSSLEATQRMIAMMTPPASR